MRRVLAVFAGVTLVVGLAVPAWAESARKSTDQPISVMAHGWHHDGWHHGDRDDHWRHHHDYDDHYYRHHRYDYDDYYYRHHRYDYDDYYGCDYYRHHYYRDCY
jgi:Ni/Co efflux regulator RcnB